MKKVIKILIYLLLSLSIIFFTFCLFFHVKTSKVKLDKDKLMSPKEICSVFNSDLSEIVPTTNFRYVKYDKIPKILKDAVIAIEDKRFYEHSGIDYKSILRALKNNFFSGKIKEGGSTITQQLVKNTYLTSDKTLERKLKEIRLATLLEKEFTKDEILEKYLNTVYYGENSYGIASASMNYFGKNVEELKIEECALLAGLLKAPTYYNPYKNPHAAKRRRNLVLDQMHIQKMISKDDVIKLKNKDIILNFNNNYDYNNTLYDEIITSALNKLNFNKISDLKGYKIYTSINSNLMLDIPKISDYSLDTDYSIIVTENKTSNIIAYSSTVGEIKRCPASCAKPWLIFAPAIEENLISPATKILDEPTDFNGYSPDNPGGKYYGYVSAKECLIKSLNLPSVKILNSVGLDKTKSYAKKMDIEYENNDLSLALGNLSGGITLKELSDAYSVFHNYGKFYKSEFILKIENARGKVVYTNTNKGKNVFSDSTAYLITDSLRECAKIGTASKLSSLPFYVCAKTGTNGNSNGNIDAYCVAYTKDHTISVWIGNKDGTIMSNEITGGNYPTAIAKETLNILYKDYKPKDILPPKSVVKVNVDKDYYTIDSKIYKNCKDEKDGIYFWFKVGQEPKNAPTIEDKPIVIKNYKITCNKRDISIITEREKGVEYYVFDKKGQVLFDSNGKGDFYYNAPYKGEFVFYIQPYVIIDDKIKVGSKIKLPSVITEGNSDILDIEWWKD